MDFILEQKDHLTMIQGMTSRKKRGARKRRQQQCRFLKHYFEPYGKDRNGDRNSGIILIENKKSNIGLKLYVEDLLRHVFN